MRIEQSHIQRTKAILHGLQALLTFIAGCLALAVLTKDGSTSPSVGFYFALCFLTIPALTYQLLVPMWTRAWRFANTYAYLAIDALFALLWFSAFIAVAVWQSQGISKGSSDGDDDDDDNDGDSAKGTCASFAYGSVAKCKTSRATIGFGVALCLLWVCTTIISTLALRRYKRTGEKPSLRPHNNKTQKQADKEADVWNPHMPSDTRPSTSSRPSSSDSARRYGQPTSTDHDSADQGLLPSGDESPEPHPGRQLSYGSGTSRIRPTTYDEEAAPSALSPTVYGERDTVINPFANLTPYGQDVHTGYHDGGRVQFPSGPY